jgi:glycerophosphoryl diester phosphodiesterase family protein
MRRLSLSRAWDETRDILARDGRLYVSVALALVVLPSVINALLNPKGMGDTHAELWVSLVSLVASLITLAGQLGLIRLALGPSITVGGAISHGFRRLPVYFVGALLIVLALLVIAMPFGVALSAMGVPLKAGAPLPATPPVLIAGLLYFAVICFIGVRMLLAAPVASAEQVGPIALLKRSWALTDGHFWQLFGFLLLFLIAATVVLIGVGAAIGVVVRLFLGPLQPMSVSALVVGLIQALLSAAFTTVLAVMLARMYVQLSGRAEETAEVFR